MKNKCICILVTLLSACIIYLSICDALVSYNNYFEISKEVKYVDSEILVEEIEDVVEAVGVEEESVEEIVTPYEKTVEVTKEVVVEEVLPPVEEKPVVEEVPVEVPRTESTNEVIYGRMSGYGPDCVGCSGYVASGKYVGSGNYYYYDDEYGQVRIVAGDKKYKFGTIVRINDSMLAIVLDRGGAIGIGKKFLFDLLYESEAVANKNGVSNNVKFEILRNGF